jgi:hypothetical protein
MQSGPLTLFIIKKFYDYGGDRQVSNGVRTSVLLVVNMLLAEGHRAKLVEAIDGNCIDRLVAENKPSRVVIEAIWVTPDKMAQLQRLWPNVAWTVRVHSELPFLAQEGMAIRWLFAYRKQGVDVAFNSLQTREDFLGSLCVGYLPNYYPMRKPRALTPSSDTLNVGCFGAIRPLKNQLIQAFAAVRYAQKHGKNLVFHMNGTRIEQQGSNNLKNIAALLEATGYKLELHPWLSHEDFLELVAEMDIVLQVSLNESFCIVASDAVSVGVPLIGSDTIDWLPKRSRAKVDSVGSIVAAMDRADETTVIMNQESLGRYLEATVERWNEWLA